MTDSGHDAEDVVGHLLSQLLQKLTSSLKEDQEYVVEAERATIDRFWA